MRILLANKLFSSLYLGSAIVLVFLLGVFLPDGLLAGAKKICPPKEVIYPCQCFEGNSQFSCKYIQKPFNITEIFRKVHRYLGRAVTYENLVIAGNPNLKEIPASALANFSFRSIRIFGNSNLATIDLNAFGIATQNVTREILVRTNNHFKSNLFVLLAKFPKLTNIALYNLKVPTGKVKSDQNSYLFFF